MVKIQSIEKLFSYLLIYSFLIIPLCYLLCKAKQKDIPIIVTIYGLVFFLLLNYYYDLPRSWRKAQQTIYTSLEYFCFSYILYKHILSKVLKKALIIISVCFFIFQIIYYFSTTLRRIDSVAVGIETIIIFIFIITFFYQFFKYSTSPIYNDPAFYLIIGVLIYLGGTFFFNILANEISKEQWNNYWHLTYIPEILKNILFGLALLLYHKSIYGKSTSKKTAIPFLDMDIA